MESLKKFQHSMEPQLRQLGLPTRLVNSKIELTRDFTLAVEGEPIAVERCKILRLLDIKLSRLKFTIKSVYDGQRYKRF